MRGRAEGASASCSTDEDSVTRHGSAAGRIGPAPSSRSRGCSALLRPLRGDCVVPMRRFASVVFGERSRPGGRLVSPKIMEANGLSRAEGSRLAKRPRSGLALTPSTGQARADPGIFEPNNLFLICRIPVILFLGRRSASRRSAEAPTEERVARIRVA